MLRLLIGALLSPVPIIVGMLVVGCVLLWARRPRPGRFIITAGTILLLLFGYGVPSEYALRWLESRYVPIADLTPLREVRWVAVLGGGQRWKPTLPVSSYPEPASLYRAVEGIRLHRGLPGSRLLFTGGAAGGPMSTARAGASVAEALGVDASAIVIDDTPMNTEEEARIVRRIVGAAPFILVTSALHMPRAMMLFEGIGLHPIPSPTEHRASAGVGTVPSAVKLDDASDAAHELLGLAWAWLRPRRLD